MTAHLLFVVLFIPLDSLTPIIVAFYRPFSRDEVAIPVVAGLVFERSDAAIEGSAALATGPYATPCTLSSREREGTVQACLWLPWLGAGREGLSTGWFREPRCGGEVVVLPPSLRGLDRCCSAR